MGFPEVTSSPVSIHCQGILFDMDGILISSTVSVVRSWTKWAVMRGVDPQEMLKIVHGCRAIETVAKLRPDLNAEAELKIIEELECDDTEGLTVLPGVQDFLRALPAERWTIVTSATGRLARVRLSVGGIPTPERLVTGEHVTRGKPHPEPFLVGAELLGFRPEQCVVFEDSASGVMAGRTAGCIVVGTTFSHPIEALDAAHYVLRDLTGVSVEAADAGLVLRLTPLHQQAGDSASPTFLD
jgi:sugar-phosphatase